MNHGETHVYIIFKNHIRRVCCETIRDTEYSRGDMHKTKPWPQHRHYLTNKRTKNFPYST